jgi:hypothetical protein
LAVRWDEGTGDLGVGRGERGGGLRAGREGIVSGFGEEREGGEKIEGAGPQGRLKVGAKGAAGAGAGRGLGRDGAGGGLRGIGQSLRGWGIPLVGKGPGVGVMGRLAVVVGRPRRLAGRRLGRRPALALEAVGEAIQGPGRAYRPGRKGQGDGNGEYGGSFSHALILNPSGTALSTAKCQHARHGQN